MKDKPKKKRANNLTGSDWIKNSISVWRDIKKTQEESALHHPGIFPSLLAERIIRCFTIEDDKYILDPFMGSGSTLIAAKKLNKIGIGFEINPDFIKKAKGRLSQGDLFESNVTEPSIYQMDARKLLEVISPDTIHLCVTSPPYWDILSQKRTADYKAIRNYGTLEEDLAQIKDYNEFLDNLIVVFSNVYKVLKYGHYCIVNVMDLRKGPNFYPFHSDLANRMQKVGYIFDDLIIWDRTKEYNNLRSLGYPYVFRINKVHEYLLIFKKPLNSD